MRGLSGSRMPNFGVELTLRIALCHFRGGQRFDFGRLPRGAERFITLFAKFLPSLQRRLKILSWIEFTLIRSQRFAHMRSRSKPEVGIDIDLADAMADAALNLLDRYAEGF